MLLGRRGGNRRGRPLQGSDPRSLGCLHGRVKGGRRRERLGRRMRAIHVAALTRRAKSKYTHAPFHALAVGGRGGACPPSSDNTTTTRRAGRARCCGQRLALVGCRPLTEGPADGRRRLPGTVGTRRFFFVALSHRGGSPLTSHSQPAGDTDGRHPHRIASHHISPRRPHGLHLTARPPPGASYRPRAAAIRWPDVAKSYMDGWRSEPPCTWHQRVPARKAFIWWLGLSALPLRWRGRNSITTGGPPLSEPPPALKAR